MPMDPRLVVKAKPKNTKRTLSKSRTTIAAPTEPLFKKMTEEYKQLLEGFKFPTKTTPQPKTEEIRPITTNNSFELLNKTKEQDVADTMDYDEATTSQHTQPRPPPIRIQTIPDDIKQFHKTINQTCTGCSISYNTKEITIRTRTETEHKTIVGLLIKNNFQFFTHRLKTEKTKRMVVKAAPFTTTSDLEQHFINNGIQVTSCIKLKGKSEYSASFLLNFQKNQDMGKVQQVKAIDNVLLRYQQYAKKEQHTQCRKCQQYGHGGTYCNRPAKCLKCAKDHITADCTKTKQTPATCANCKGDHPANYKGCIAYLDYVTNIQKRTGEKIPKTTTQHTPTLRTIPTTSFRTTVPSFSYSQAVNANRETPETSENNPPNINKFQTLHDTLNKINSLCNIDLLINIANDLLHIVQTITDNVDRVMALASLKIKYQAQ